MPEQLGPVCAAVAVEAPKVPGAHCRRSGVAGQGKGHSGSAMCGDVLHDISMTFALQIFHSKNTYEEHRRPVVLLSTAQRALRTGPC